MGHRPAADRRDPAGQRFPGEQPLHGLEVVAGDGEFTGLQCAVAEPQQGRPPLLGEPEPLRLVAHLREELGRVLGGAGRQGPPGVGDGGAQPGGVTG
ncbi:hypothetical protein SANTM175S_07336 [Streptomyces antimycoticus]